MSRASRFRLREPFSGISHLFGAALSIAGLAVLLVLSRGDGWRLTSFSIYGASLIVLYSASGIYHSLPVGPTALERLRKFDHCGIFFLIAGSYTPICLGPLRSTSPGWAWSLFGVVWAIALVGILSEILWPSMPPWFDLMLYLIMGWMALIGIGPLIHVFSSAALAWLIGGGIVYSIGAIFYATERPRLWPGVFGSHDLWHIFVLGGSFSHFMMMLTFAMPSH